MVIPKAKFPEMKHRGTVELVIERLKLRRFVIEDAEDFYNMCSKEQVTRFLSYQPHPDVGHTKELLKSWIEKYEDLSVYHWAIEYGGHVIGSIGTDKNDDECRSCSLGWQLDFPYWNKGFMTEAAKAVISFLEEEGYIRISSCHDVENPASGKVMQKAGMKLEGVLLCNGRRRDGSLYDLAVYSYISKLVR